MTRLASRVALLAALLALVLPAAAQTSTWQVDPAHSAAQFSVRHMMISNVKGEFSHVSGTALLDESDLSRSSVEISVDTTTVDTREPRRDAHLRSADFFDAANFPAMIFRSKQITRLGEGRYQLTGDLTIRGTTREVIFEIEGPTAAVKDPQGSIRRGLTATARVNRRDFGLNWNRALEAGGLLVGDDVAITVDIELVKQAGGTR